MECGNRFNTLEVMLEEGPRVSKPVAQKAAFVAEEVVQKIRDKKREARRAVEDMQYLREEADTFELDEDIQWKSNL